MPDHEAAKQILYWKTKRTKITRKTQKTLEWLY